MNRTTSVLSRDGRTLALGGLLSVLKGQPEISSTTSRTRPRRDSSRRPIAQSAITDEFYAIPGGGFLVTMMAARQGTIQGRVVEFDRTSHRRRASGAAAGRRLQPGTAFRSVRSAT
jgi:hypothetical protein